MRLFNYSQNWVAGGSSHKMSSRGNIISIMLEGNNFSIWQ